jgi:anti-sigma factor (TIGR02949 family)
MRCRQVIDKISEYIDGELDPELVRELERHLEHCEDCRIVVDTTRKTVEIFCHTEPAALPEDVRGRLNQMFAQRFRKEEPR